MKYKLNILLNCLKLKLPLYQIGNFAFSWIVMIESHSVFLQQFTSIKTSSPSGAITLGLWEKFWIYFDDWGNRDKKFLSRSFVYCTTVVCLYVCIYVAGSSLGRWVTQTLSDTLLYGTPRTHLSNSVVTDREGSRVPIKCGHRIKSCSFVIKRWCLC